MLALSAERQPRRSMDVTVTQAADCRRAWTLTDLLGRPMGRITEARGPGFMIDPDERAPLAMVELRRGPYSSLDDAMKALERQMHGTCRLAPEEPRADHDHQRALHHQARGLKASS